AGGGDPARLTATASDASFRLDGLSMTSESNDTGMIAPGLSLKLTGTNIGSPTQIGFNSPAGYITAAMNDLVSALNEVAGELRAASDPVSGDLARVRGARALHRFLSWFEGDMMMPGAASGAPKTLCALGLAIQRDGIFRMDAIWLQATIDRDRAGAAA